MSVKALIRGLLPRTHKPHRILAGPLKGNKLVTSWHDYPGALTGRTERRLLDWFAQNVHVGETWLDVGAHYGYTAISLARLVGPTGRVFAFEPMLNTVGSLARTRAVNHLEQITVAPFALGELPGLRTAALPATRG